MLEKDKTRVEYIINTIDKLIEINEQKSFEEFDSDFLLKLASERLLETIAEACNAMSSDFKDTNNNIDWSSIRGMRNIIVHENFSVNYKVLYNTIFNQLPILKTQLLQSK
jgi:uncharacterized protein with HEPN domain